MTIINHSNQKPVQPSKIWFQISVAFSGMITLVSPVQLARASPPIWVIFKPSIPVRMSTFPPLP
jgi:hypothetical protein